MGRGFSRGPTWVEPRELRPSPQTGEGCCVGRERCLDRPVQSAMRTASCTGCAIRRPTSWRRRCWRCSPAGQDRHRPADRERLLLRLRPAAPAHAGGSGRIEKRMRQIMQGDHPFVRARALGRGSAPAVRRPALQAGADRRPGTRAASTNTATTTENAGHLDLHPRYLHRPVPRPARREHERDQPRRRSS